MKSMNFNKSKISPFKGKLVRVIHNVLKYEYKRVGVVKQVKELELTLEIDDNLHTSIFYDKIVDIELLKKK